MIEYKSKEEFINEISNSAKLFINEFSDIQEAGQKIVKLTEGYTDTELFQSGGRKWASSTPSNWAIWKWIHTNTVAPFKSFRSKIRKWKKLNQS